MDPTCSTCMPAGIHQSTLTWAAISYFLCFWFCTGIIGSGFFFFHVSFNLLSNFLRPLQQAPTLLPENLFDFTSSSRCRTDQTFHC